MEILRALAVLAEPPQPEHAPIRAALGIEPEPAAADHTDLFALQLVPYASVYLNEDGMLGGDARERIAGFWRALYVLPPAEPDTLGALLAFYADLRERERTEPEPARRALVHRAQAALIWEHLAPWAFAYARKAREIASPFYAAWASLLYDALAVAVTQAEELGALPVHLSAVAAMPSAQDGAEAFLTALLAPARSGLVLTRTDLHRAGADAGLGLRQGERRYILRALIGQDSNATLEWLEAEALAWELRHAAMEEVPRPIRGHWAHRARETAERIAIIRAMT